jgi:3-oxoacyl-[acyl-carrier-protein] synthase III
MEPTKPQSETDLPFFDRPNVQREVLPFGPGIPLGIECISSPALGIGGAYGTWGTCYDNDSLPGLIEERLGRQINPEERLNLSELGFFRRHHVPLLSREDDLELEVQIGVRMLRAALQALGWEPGEVEALLIGMSGPISEDYTEQIARLAGIPERALKFSIHKACDSSVAGLNLALNPDLPIQSRLGRNVARELLGKKVLVGGIEGLSRFGRFTKDLFALQLFGNGAGVIGVIPGRTMKFLAGASHEVFDQEGVVQMHMYYPHSKHIRPDQPLIDVLQVNPSHIRLAGLMYEPATDQPIVMAGPMGMVKLFVRSGVQVVQEAYEAYRKKMEELGMPGKDLAVAIVHHANLKINQLKEKRLQKLGIQIPMPWLLKEFGNVSAASNMIAFLRDLPALKPGDHVLIDGFGAGTYYDVLAVEMGGV